ncbi:hypothetical protein BDR04DRAFT_1152415 [Suillus decipiens]|nr:hypothetical protein BDR04DRAFT_1152415 [Suillus decipiens]
MSPTLTGFVEQKNSKSPFLNSGYYLKPPTALLNSLRDVLLDRDESRHKRKLGDKNSDGNMKDGDEELEDPSLDE